MSAFPKDLPGLLFPHSCIGESELKQVLFFFGSLTVCQPWFMAEPSLPLQEREHPLIQLVRPSEKRKPPDDFLRLLREYERWMQENQDKGYAAYLSAEHDAALSEETKWGIRQMIQSLNKGGDQSAENQAHTFRWHLILHLTHRLEANQKEAEDLVVRLRALKPPLADALEDATASTDLFEDLTSSDSEPLIKSVHWDQVFDAWFSLFQEYLNTRAVLVTVLPEVMGRISDIFEETLIQGENTTPDQTLELSIPDVTPLSLDEITDMREGIPREEWGQAVGAVTNALEQRADLGSAFSSLSETLEKACPKTVRERRVPLRVRRFPCIAVPGRSDKERAINALSGKTLTLIGSGQGLDNV
jgi:hypothetical protein